MVFFIDSCNSSSQMDSTEHMPPFPVMDPIDVLVDRLTRWFQMFTEFFGLQNYVEVATQFAIAHPITFLLFILMFLICCLPFLLFGIFVLLTLGLTFTGFLFLEGTLITVGTFIFGGALFAVISLVIGMGVCAGLTWFIFNNMFYLAFVAKSKVEKLWNELKPLAAALSQNTNPTTLGSGES